MARTLACFTLFVVTRVRAAASCDAAGMQKCTSDFASASAGTSTEAKCAALETYEACFTSTSAGCPASFTKGLSSQMESAKAQMSCSGSSGDDSATQQGEDVSIIASGSDGSSNVVTLVCDATGINECVTAFSTGVAGASNVAAKCSILDTYEKCVKSKSAGCSAAQQSAFTTPVESAKSSMSCQENELASNSPSSRPCALFVAVILSALIHAVSVH